VVNRWLHQTSGLGAAELKKRTRQLNFPALSPNDSAVKRRLHSILAESMPASQCSKFLSQVDDTDQQADQGGPAGSAHTACASSAESAPLPSLFGAHMGLGLGAGQQGSGRLPSFQSSAASNHSAAAAVGPAAAAADSELGGESPGAVSVAAPVEGIWGMRIQAWVNARNNHAQRPTVMGLAVALPTPTLVPGGAGAGALAPMASAAAGIAGGAAAAGRVGALCQPAAVPSAFAAASCAAASDAPVLDAPQATIPLLTEQQEQPASAPVVPTATALGTAAQQQQQQQHGSGGAAPAALSEGCGAGLAATTALDMLDAQDVDSLMAFFAEEGDLSLPIDSLQLPELPLLLPAAQQAAGPQEQQGVLISGQGQQQPATALDTVGTGRCDLSIDNSAAGACGTADTFMYVAARQSSGPQQCQDLQQQLGLHTGGTITRAISLSALCAGGSSSMTGLDISAAAQRAGLLRASLSPPPQQLQQPAGLVTWSQPQEACQMGQPQPVAQQLQFQFQHRPSSLQLPELLPLYSCCPTVTHLAAAAGSWGQQQCADSVEPVSGGLGPTYLDMTAPVPASATSAAPAAPAEGTAAWQAGAAQTASSAQQAGTGDAVAAGSAAGADIGAGGGAGAGLFDCITTQEQTLAVIRACMHVLTDLELYLLQQPHTVSAVGAMLDYMHAAWHSEAARSGAVSVTAGAAAIAAAAAEAKATPPSAHAPRHMSLLMLGKVVQLTADLLSGRAADVGLQRGVSLKVVVELQQGVTDVQRRVAGGEQVRVKDGLQAWASGNLVAGAESAVTGVILSLIGQL